MPKVKCCLSNTVIPSGNANLFYGIDFAVFWHKKRNVVLNIQKVAAVRFDFAPPLILTSNVTMFMYKNFYCSRCTDRLLIIVYQFKHLSLHIFVWLFKLLNWAVFRALINKMCPEIKLRTETPQSGCLVTQACYNSHNFSALPPLANLTFFILKCANEVPSFDCTWI